MQITFILRHLGFQAISINGKMTQSNRIGALNKFKEGDRNILVANDFASRGLDLVIIYIGLEEQLEKEKEEEV